MYGSKVFLSEFIGTFALVFIGAGAGVAGAGLVGVALAHGFTIAVFVYAYGNISGTHINPAVTFGLLLQGTLKMGQALLYWAAQFLGAIAAAGLLRLVAGDISGGATVGSLTDAAPVLALVVEAVLTFFLVNTILHTAVAGKGGAFAGWAIGTTLVFAILAGGPLTGASLNPARTFGPALFTGAFANPMTYVIYFLGPLIGSTLAVIIFNYLTDADAKSAAEASAPSPTRKTARKK